MGQWGIQSIRVCLKMGFVAQFSSHLYKMRTSVGGMGHPIFKLIFRESNISVSPAILKKMQISVPSDSNMLVTPKLIFQKMCFS